MQLPKAPARESRLADQQEALDSSNNWTARPTRLTEIFAQKDGLLFGLRWAHRHLAELAAGSYGNSTAAVVAKLLLRPHADDDEALSTV